MALPQTPPRRKPGGMRASRPTFARLAAAAPFGRALATACRGGPWPSRRSLRCGKPGGTMRASSPTEVALSQGLRLPVWSQALAAVRRGGFHIRPRSPAPPQTGPIWNRSLQGLRCGRARGWPRAPPLFVGVGFIPPVEPCGSAGLRLAAGVARHRRAGVHARRTAEIQNRGVRAAAGPAANRAGAQK